MPSPYIHIGDKVFVESVGKVGRVEESREVNPGVWPYVRVEMLVLYDEGNADWHSVKDLRKLHV